MAFASVLGHERAKEILAGALAQRRLPPAVLLCGPRGVGKRTLALAVGRGLLCEGGGEIPCDACPSCRRAQRGIHPDLVLVDPEGATIKVDRIREVAREIASRPFEASARAFVLDDAHLLTEQASNALLKSLEEPCPTSHVFLVTASPQALLPTIRSRCQTLRLSALPSSLLQEYLQQRLGLSSDQARLRAALSGGSLGAALAFEAEAYRTLRGEVLALLEGLGRLGPLERMEAAERMADLEDPDLALTALRSLLRDAAALGAGAPPEAALNADVVSRLQGLARGPLAARAVALADAVSETREALRGNANRLLSMDVLVDLLATRGARPA